MRAPAVAACAPASMFDLHTQQPCCALSRPWPGPLPIFWGLIQAPSAWSKCSQWKWHLTHSLSIFGLAAGAICLEQIQPVEMAIVKGCEHLYCICCILRWSTCREAVTCPQCKTPFRCACNHASNHARDICCWVPASGLQQGTERGFRGADRQAYHPACDASAPLRQTCTGSRPQLNNFLVNCSAATSMFTASWTAQSQTTRWRSPCAC